MAIALTFDDGPDPVWTPVVLDALAAVGAHGTFFVVGPRAERFGALIERCLAEGHTVGLHCDEHVRHTDREADWLVADTERALARLARLGVEPHLWRVPHGDIAPHTFTIAHDHGLALVGWDADTGDWQGTSADEMLAAIADQLYDGAIVRMHDAVGPQAAREDCEQTVALVEMLAEWAQTAGVSLRALPSRALPA